VDVEVPVNAFNKDPLAYKGFWVDGGVLNNLPIHAFDANFMDEAKAGSFTEELNPQMVALRLTPGFPPGSGPPAAVDPDSIGLSAFLGMFGDAILYPSESGQLRTAGEAEQTIDLYTYKLETTDFAPPKEKSEPAIKYAEQRVLQDFNPGTGGLN
jgi:predicted acylesterase/phospholipase RssA